jgi:hypothetical protein
MTISVTKPKQIDSIELHKIKIKGKIYIDKCRDCYSDGTKSEWENMVPPKEIKFIQDETPCMRTGCQYNRMFAENRCVRYEDKCEECPMFIPYNTKEV